MFILRKIEGGRQNVFEPQVLTVGESVVAGQALKFNATSGKLVVCGATDKPVFIALAAAAADAEVSVGRVEPNQVYETEYPASSTLVVGKKYTLNAADSSNPASVKITATDTSGVAEVISAVNGVAYVRFS